MATENKVRVTKLLGGGGALGVMSPKVGMSTHQGTVTAISTDGTLVTVSGDNVGTPTVFYPHQLFVTQDHASGVHAFPTGDGSVLFGRPSSWQSSGVPDAIGSGMAFMGGDGDVFTFSR